MVHQTARESTGGRAPKRSTGAPVLTRHASPMGPSAPTPSTEDSSPMLNLQPKTTAKKRKARGTQWTRRKTRKTDKGKQPAASDKETPFPFLALPKEIRDMIYELALPQGKTCIAVYNSAARDYVDDCRLRRPLHRQEEPSLLAVCGMIRDEATPLYYGRNKFAVFIHNFDFGLLLRWTKLISPHAVAAIQQLDLWFLGDIGWTNPTKFVQAAEELSFPMSKVRYRGEEDQSSAFGTGCQQTEDLRKFGLTWDQIESTLDKSQEMMKRSNWGNEEWSISSGYYWEEELVKEFGHTGDCHCLCYHIHGCFKCEDGDCDECSECRQNLDCECPCCAGS